MSLVEECLLLWENPLNSTVGRVTDKANSVFGVNFNTESSDSDKGKKNSSK